jgi:hypothetical protein
MFEKLGIAQEVSTKTKLAAGGPNGRISTIVASGDADIGLQQAPDSRHSGQRTQNCAVVFIDYPEQH